MSVWIGLPWLEWSTKGGDTQKTSASNRTIIHYTVQVMLQSVWGVCSKEILQKLQIILLILTVYVSYSYCYNKMSSDGNIYFGYCGVLFYNMHFISFFHRSWRSRYHSSCFFFIWKTNIANTKINITVTPSIVKRYLWCMMRCPLSGRETTRAAGWYVHRFSKFYCMFVT
jgi:hypothetical protein